MTRRTFRWTLPAALLSLAIPLAMIASPVAAKPTLPSGFTKQTVAKGLKTPIDMAFAPDGRLFVVEQQGRVRIVRSDRTLKTFLNIKSKVDHTAGRGLLGIAFDPNFESNGYVYLDYTKKASSTQGPHTVVVRVKADRNKAVPDSEVQLLRLDRQRTPNHTGGALAFGPEGRLYISTGDNEQSELAQKRKSTMGKILRINTNGTIPKSNPFYDKLKGRKRAIWARGLRNPFKMDVSTAGTVYINDVGEDTWEEINRGRRGANYGWDKQEGASTDPKFTSPLFTYGHGGSGKKGCAITAGAFYDPATAKLPASYIGDYFYADYCSGWVRRYDPVSDSSKPFGKGFTKPVLDIEVASTGELFLLLRAAKGKIIKIAP